MPDNNTLPLSQQDMADLNEIKSKLPGDHPMRAKIDQTLSMNSGEMQTKPGGPVTEAPPLQGVDKPDTGEYQPLGTHESFTDQMNDAAGLSMIAAPFQGKPLPMGGEVPAESPLPSDPVGTPVRDFIAGGVRNVGKAIAHPQKTVGEVVNYIADKISPEKSESEPDYAANRAINRQNLTRSVGSSGPTYEPYKPAISNPNKPTISQPKPELGSPENPGFVVKLPGRMPKPAPEPEPEPANNIDYSRNQRLNRAQLTKPYSSMDKGGPATGGNGPSTVGRKIGGPGSAVPSGRSIGAGDLASWSKDDLWSQYMKESQGPNKDFAKRISDELARRGEVRAVGTQIK